MYVLSPSNLYGYQISGGLDSSHEEIVLHVLTGVEVMEERLPRLFEDSWWPKSYRLVYGDLTASYPRLGIVVDDVLASSADLVERARDSDSPEWVYYRSIHRSGSPTRKSFAGWQLDKWKFMAAHRMTVR